MKTTSLRTRVLQSTAIAGLLLGGTFGNALAQNNNSVETVTVTANRAQAQEIKKDSPRIIEVQPYTEIRKLPDVSVAEALQRIPGISMESDSGEGRFINIRGLDADLNGTTYDGVVLTANNQNASPRGGERAVAFDAFPAEVIGGIEVIKTLTPDMDATGLGGVINLLPRSPAANGSYYVDASVGSGIAPLRERPLIQASATASTTFDFGDHTGSDRFSVVGTYAMYEDWRGIDDVEEGYQNDPFTGDPANDKQFNNLQLRWYEYHRTRQGVGGLFNFQPNADNTFYVHALYSGYVEHAHKHRLVLAGLGSGVLPGAFLGNDTFDAPTAIAQQQFTDSTEHVANGLIAIGGHSILGAVKADYRLSWTRALDDFPTNFNGNFSTPNTFDVHYNNANPAFPSFQVQTPGINLADPSQFILPAGANSISNGLSRSFESEWAGALDFTLPLDLVGQDGVFKFGGMARLRQRGASTNQMTFASAVDVSLAGLTSGPSRTYYKNHYTIGPNLSDKTIENLPSLFLSDPLGDQQTDLAGFAHQDENVYAGYVQYSTVFGPLSVITGVRFEATDGTNHANLGTVDTLGNLTFAPDRTTESYTNFFPSLQGKYTVDDQTQVRAAFSTAIARPGFNQISASEIQDFSALPDITITTGNPNLRPETGKNFDLDVEHYMPNGGLATAGVFYKYFSNYILSTQTRVNNTGGVGQTITNSFSNIGVAFAEGAEASYIQKFVFLPDPLDGLGFDGNVTYVHARGTIRLPPLAFQRSQLPETSPFTFNAELFYEKGPVGIRLGASYVSKNIFSVGSDSTQDVFSQPRFRLDLGTTYDVCDNIELYFSAKNLSNTLLEFTQTSSKEFPIQREFYGPTYFFGVRVKLGEGGEFKGSDAD